MDPFFNNFVNYISISISITFNCPAGEFIHYILWLYQFKTYFPGWIFVKKSHNWPPTAEFRVCQKMVKNPNIFICCVWFQLSLYGHPWDILLFAWYMFFFLRLICLNCLFCQEIEFAFFLIGTEAKLVKPNIKHITGFLKLFGGGA